MRDAAEAIAGRIVPLAWQPGVTVLVYVAPLTLINEIGALPLGFYSGFFLERRYDLSNETFRGWIGDQAKSLGIGILLGGGAAGLLLVHPHSPTVGWLSPASPSRADVGLTNLAPCS